MHNVMIGAIAILLSVTGTVWGATATFDITVDAGRHERRNVPVRVIIPGGQPKFAAVTLTGPDGKAIPAQVTGPGLLAGNGNELHFILKHLPAGETLRLTAVFIDEPKKFEDGFSWLDRPGLRA